MRKKFRESFLFLVEGEDTPGGVVAPSKDEEDQETPPKDGEEHSDEEEGLSVDGSISSKKVSGDESSQKKEEDDEEGSGEKDSSEYPANTAVKDMTPTEQAAYWRAKARRWEDRAKSAVSRKDHERELEAIRATARSEADHAARSHYAPLLAKEAIRARVVGALDDDQLESSLEFVDLNKFLTPSGEVDADKVNTYAAGIVPKDGLSGHKLPPSGQDRDAAGRGGRHTVSSAKDEYLSRHRAKAS